MSNLPSRIRYISINTVRPANKTEDTGPADLTPWDLLTLRATYTQRGLLFSKPGMQVEDYSDTRPLIDRLMRSLSLTLDYFLYLAGRLAIKKHQDDDTISFYIDCNALGAQFVHASAETITVADVLEPIYTPEVVYSLFPLNNLLNHQGTESQPLLAVQVTELVDGIFIGCSINHVIADGTSFWHFMNCWSEISRALPLDHVPSRLPVVKRWLFSEDDLPIRFPSTIQDQLARRFSPPLEIQKGIFHFTPEKLAQLKLQANAEGETNIISSFQALIGHVWITTTHARGVGPAEEVASLMAIGNRSRLNPPLPQEYFGNSAQVVIATAKAGELLERALGWAAWLVNRAIRSHSEADIRNYWDTGIKNPVMYISHKLPIPNNQIVGSSPRFDMYGNDFGWGRPIATRSGCPSSDGEVLVHPGAVEGSMDVELSLSPQAFSTIRDYTEFTQVIAN